MTSLVAHLNICFSWCNQAAFKKQRLSWETAGPALQKGFYGDRLQSVYSSSRGQKLQLTCWASVCLNAMLKQWKRNHQCHETTTGPRIELAASAHRGSLLITYLVIWTCSSSDLSCVLTQEVRWSPEFCCLLDVTGSSSRIQEAPHDFCLAANRKVNHSRAIQKNNNSIHLRQWQDWNTFLSSFDFLTFILIFFPEIMLYLPLFLSFKYWKP